MRHVQTAERAYDIPDRQAPRHALAPRPDGPRKSRLATLSVASGPGRSAETEIPDSRAVRTARIGSRIRTLRRARGWTQEELACACDVTRSAIAQWESGRAGQQAQHLAAVAKALEVSVAALCDIGPLTDGAATEDERHLLALFRRCSVPQRDCLLMMADTLAAGDDRAHDGRADGTRPEPRVEPRVEARGRPPARLRVSA